MVNVIDKSKKKFNQLFDFFPTFIFCAQKLKVRVCVFFYKAKSTKHLRYERTKTCSIKARGENWWKR